MERRKFISGLGLISACAVFLPVPVKAENGQPMDAITALKTRRSVRKYTAEPVSEADIKTILECGMLAPSAMNEQPWHFVVIQDKEILHNIPSVMPNARMAAEAPLAILTCLDSTKEMAKGMGVLDVAASTENMLLAAHALGLGAVWTGIFPDQERMEAARKLFNLPADILPIALIVIGHPDQPLKSVDRFKPERIHQNKW